MHDVFLKPMWNIYVYEIIILEYSWNFLFFYTTILKIQSQIAWGNHLEKYLPVGN